MNIPGIETDSSGMAVKTQEYGGMAMKKSRLISFAIALVSIAVCCLNMPLRVLAEEKKGTTTGQYITLDYGWNTTTVTDKQGRDTTYQFSNGGQAVSIRDKDHFNKTPRSCYR